jgi:hypothetical protein
VSISRTPSGQTAAGEALNAIVETQNTRLRERREREAASRQAELDAQERVIRERDEAQRKATAAQVTRLRRR